MGSIVNSPSAVNSQPPAVGLALAALRERQGLSLEQLSRKAGVSKSMLSQVERQRANPTVAVVWRLAQALGVPIAQLLEGGLAEAPAPAITAVSAQDTPRLVTPDARCELRILGPVALAGRFEWYELRVAPGGELVSPAHERGSREHLSVQAGVLEVQAGAHTQRLRAGETARYAADQPHAIRNPQRTPATALLVVLQAD